MNSKVRLLNEHEIQQISGGHPAAAIGTLGLIMFALELPHIFMGMREFVNYVGERLEKGRENIDEDDYFSKILLWKF